MWLSPTRRSLYRVIPSLFHDQKSAGLLIETMRSSSAIRAYVRKLYITTPPMLDLVPLLPRCKVLICDTGYFDYLPEALFNLTTLTALHLDLTSRYLSEMSVRTFMASVAPRWDQLQRLRISVDFRKSNLPRNLFTNVTESEVCLPSLIFLHLDGFGDVPVLPIRPNSLKTLIIESCEFGDLDDFLCLIRMHEQSLVHLELENIGYTDPFVFKGLLAGLLCLQHFLYVGMNWDYAEDKDRILCRLFKLCNLKRCWSRWTQHWKNLRISGLQILH
jgi:hypothetical protein